MARCGLRLLVFSLAISAMIAGDFTRLSDIWIDEDCARKNFKKILVLGITEDPQGRRQFENKAVSHLRGRGYESLVSYQLVPDLTHIQAEGTIRRQLDEEQIDSALVFRVIALTGKNEDAWAEQWNAAMVDGVPLRELIDAALPLGKTKARYFGVTVGLWEAEKGARIWGARSAVISAKQLKKGRSGDFIQAVMGQLKIEDLL